MKKPNKKKKKKVVRKKSQAESSPKVVSSSGSTAVIKGTEKAKKTVQKIPKREPEKKKEDKGSVVRYLGIAGQFLREARSELKKVKWPARKELLASTAMVIVLVLIVAFFLGLIDFGLIKLIKNIVG